MCMSQIMAAAKADQINYTWAKLREPERSTTVNDQWHEERFAMGPLYYVYESELKLCQRVQLGQNVSLTFYVSSPLHYFAHNIGRSKKPHYCFIKLTLQVVNSLVRLTSSIVP